MGSVRTSGVRWSLVVALTLAGCGDTSWTEWTPIDATPMDTSVVDAVGSSIIVSEVGSGADASDASDVSDASDAADASDASDGGEADVTAFEFDVVVADAGAPGVDVTRTVDVAIELGRPIDVPVDRGAPVDIAIDRGSPINVGVDVPVDRGVPVDIAIDRGSPIDIPIDRGSPIDVPIDRGSPIDVPIDRGSPVDVPIDRGSPVDVGVDVPIDRGSPVDIPIDRGSPVDVGVDVPPADAGVTGSPSTDPVAYSGSFAARTGRFTATLTVQGERRSVVLVVPTSAGASPPLLMLFHGTNGDGSVVLSESNAQTLANSAGVIVAAPTSRWRPVGDFDHATEETYWETAPNADVNNNQDLVLVRAIMAEARRAYGVDPMRIYAMGHSNGAFFAQFVAVLLRDRIAAFSENSGGLVRCGRTTSCRFQGSGTSCAALRTQSGYCSCAGAELPVAVPSSGRMPPGLLTHGTRDPMVSVYYTCTLADLMTARGHSQVTQLFNGEGHGVPSNWAQLVWPFFAARRLGDR